MLQNSFSQAKHRKDPVSRFMVSVIRVEEGFRKSEMDNLKK
jgi:hypothetical protein